MTDRLADPAPLRPAEDIAAVLERTEVGRDLLAVDWEATPLGPPQAWPQSLAAMVSVVVSSRFSMWMAWGPELTFFCNDAYRRDTLGRKYPWALGRPAYEVWEEIWPDIGPRIDTVMRTGEATWDEGLLLFLERSGYVEETYHTFSYSPLRDDDGAITGMLCVVSEDTEQVLGGRRMRTLRDLGAEVATKRTEEEVVASVCATLAQSDRTLPFSAIYLFDDDGRTATRACTAGIPDGHPVAPETLTVGDADAPWAIDGAAQGRARVFDELPQLGVPLPTGDWSEQPLQVTIVPLPHQGSARPLGFLLAALNRFRAYDEAYEGFVGLVAGQVGTAISSARAYEAERQRAEALAELDRAKTAFFINVSHELRTPLTLLLGPAENALHDRTHPLPEPQRRRVEVIQRNGSRLLKLVNTLLDFSRLEARRDVARFEPVDLGRYTAELASMFESATDRAGLSLTIDRTQAPAEPVHVDREMWAKVVLNLVSNALKHTFAGGITVTVDTDERGRARVRVADTGVGIDPVEQGRLFERFHRVAGAKARSHEGSGIGLALVAELTKVHGGDVGVESAPDVGTTFTVALPFGTDHLPPEQLGTQEELTHAEELERVAADHAEGFVTEALRWLGEEPHEADGAGAGLDAPNADRPRILVADDNADMRQYIASLLAPEYRVETAADGAEALERALLHPPDLVLTDVMMPELDGFGLLAALSAAPATMHVPVVMLSARAGEEGILEGLEAGADDYLVKPFGARELLARVRANLELDRARHTRDRLERSQALLDQAQRLARVGSWELELASGAVIASDEFCRQLQLTQEELLGDGFEAVMQTRVHPDDLPQVRATIARAAEEIGNVDYETRILLPGGEERIFRTIGEAEADAEGRAVRIRGSNQDVTEQRQAEQALAETAAEREASAREHRIADELQRSLLPERTFQPDHLDVATFYRPGVEGTQVGGDWYDVIELGAGRAALVIGDVMGRGVRAAAVMGQLRSATRAYARLDLPPADVLELLDGVVSELGANQIVTCVYAIFDPTDRSLVYANAGHLPPLLSVPGEGVRRLASASGPPLGGGPFTLREEQVELPVGALLALYTDGLVERRDRDIDTRLDELGDALAAQGDEIDAIPARLVEALIPGELDDDVAVLVARVPGGSSQTTPVLREIASEPRSVGAARDFVTATLDGWEAPRHVLGTATLLVSELVTNAVLHGRPPIELRLRRTATELVIEVFDGATFLPRKRRPEPDDEHGRGLQLVATLADRWGTRPLQEGKAV